MGQLTLNPRGAETSDPLRHAARPARLARPDHRVAGETSLRTSRVVIVDDHEANVVLLERLLRHWGYVDVTGLTESTTVVDVCAQIEPDLLLLDLQMPEPDGFQVMDLLARADGGRFPVPILVLTADLAPEAKEQALSMGAKDFLHKPFDPTEVRLRIRNLLETRRLHLELHRYNEELEGRVRERTADLQGSRLEILDRLALAAEYRDYQTNEHARRIGRTAGLLADRLGLPTPTGSLLRRVAPLHDIGKIGVPDQVLLKPDRLTTEEREVMKAHTTIGARMLSGSQSPLLQLAEEVALTHHERWDGAGYPAGLAGAAIPIGGSIVAVADVFDALAHRRPYKQAWPVHRAVAEIHAHSGVQFDPRVVEAFLALDHRTLLEPVGTANDAHATAGLGASAPSTALGHGSL